jgi:hypothetical protein
VGFYENDDWKGVKLKPDEMDSKEPESDYEMR